MAGKDDLLIAVQDTGAEPAPPVGGISNDDTVKPELVTEDSAPNANPDGNPDPNQSADTQGKPVGTEADTLVIADETVKVKFTDENGDVHEVPFHQLRASAMLREEYDRWQNTERKPLEAVQEQYNRIIQEWQDNPQGFLTATLENAVRSNALDIGQMLHDVYRLARNNGIQVDLVDMDTGTEWQPPEPTVPRRDPREIAADRQTRELHQRQFDLQVENMILKTLMQPQYAGKLTDVSPIVKRAEELTRRNYEIFAEKNPQNPFGSALEFAITEAKAAGSNALNGLNTPGSPPGGPLLRGTPGQRQAPVPPAKPRPLLDAEMPEYVKKAYAAGVLKPV